MENKFMLSVQVSYSAPEKQFLVELKVTPGSTIQQTIQQSGVLNAFADLELVSVTVGIYSKIKTLTTVVREGDRIEIYRPLQVDPMVARQRRAKK